MFEYKTTVRMCHTDAAGIMFFANAFVLMHECYEAFLEQTVSIGQMISDGDYIIPIVHTEADYKISMKVSDKINIALTLGEVKRTSFELDYTITNQAGDTTVTVKAFHAVVDAKTRRPMRLPDQVKEFLAKLES